MFACVQDGLAHGSFGVGAGQDCLPECGEDCRVAFVAGVGFVVLEPLRQLLGVVEDVLHGARHVHHLRHFSRALMACTVVPSTTPTS